MSADAVLQISGLTVTYEGRQRQIHAVDDVSLRIGAGERVGIVGESGSGKSTLAFAIMKLLRPPGRITAGSILFENRDLAQLDEKAMQRVRGSRVAMIYQDPFTYLNPVMRVGDQIAELFTAHTRASRRDARRSVLALLEQLDLPNPATLIDAYPHQLSGGQRQRIVIGMAVALNPTLLVADEPTTALDVTVQAQILGVLRQVVDRLGASLILITHDISVVRAVCDRVVVMYAGKLVEVGPARSVLENSGHPYTAALLASSRRLTDGRKPFASIDGSPPDLADPPRGCRFAPRCPFVMEKCAEPPPLFPLGPGHAAACWLRSAATA